MDIKIDNLTTFQHHLLDKIWECKTEDALREWLSTLPSNVVKEALSLVKVLQYEFMEEALNDAVYPDEVNDYLHKFML